MTHIIGSDGPTNANPLVMLAQALQAINTNLSMVADNTKRQRPHRYIIIEGRDPGMWLSYCDACSDEVQQYCHPCRIPGGAVPPPMFGVSPEDVERLQGLAPKEDAS